MTLRQITDVVRQQKNCSKSSGLPLEISGFCELHHKTFTKVPIAPYLSCGGCETILDDCTERAGLKFKDSEPICILFCVATGKSLKDGRVEIVKRKDGDRQDLAIDEVVAIV